MTLRTHCLMILAKAAVQAEAIQVEQADHETAA
jgi:hypothetical protein